MNDDFIRGESQIRQFEARWLDWLKQVQKEVGGDINLDGSDDEEGWSLDGLFEMFQDGNSPSVAADHIFECLEGAEYDGQPDEAQEWHDFDPDC